MHSVQTPFRFWIVDSFLTCIIHHLNLDVYAYGLFFIASVEASIAIAKMILSVMTTTKQHFI